MILRQSFALIFRLPGLRNSFPCVRYPIPEHDGRKRLAGKLSDSASCGYLQVISKWTQIIKKRGTHRDQSTYESSITLKSSLVDNGRQVQKDYLAKDARENLRDFLYREVTGTSESPHARKQYSKPIMERRIPVVRFHYLLESQKMFSHQKVSHTHDRPCASDPDRGC